MSYLTERAPGTALQSHTSNLSSSSPPYFYPQKKVKEKTFK